MPRRKKNDYYPDLCRFMSYTHHGDLTHYPPKTTPLFSNETLLALTPKDVLNYFNFITYGMPNPSANDLPKLMRKCTIQHKKKAISFYMPHHGEWNTVTNHGNPTREKSILAMIARLGKFQTRHQGKASQVKRDLTMPEFKLAIDMLDADCNNWSDMKWATAIRTQFHVIGRGDDIHHVQTQNFSQHPRFDFACQTKLNWSKNVRDERDCPFQIILGAMNASFCMLLSLAIYLEVRFATFGIDSKFLFTEEYSQDLPQEDDGEEADDPAPLASLAAYSKQVTNKVFKSARMIALTALTAGKVGMHSIRKCASTLAKRMGASQDDVDIRGRWKGDSGGRTSTRYINPHQPYVDANTAALLCVDGPIKYKFKEGAHVGPAFFAEHVCPNINQYFPATSKMAETLGPALLWACFEPSVATLRVPAWLCKKVKDAYEDCRPEAWESGVNPIERVPLAVFKVGELLCIKEKFPGNGAPAGGGGAASTATGQDIIQDHVTAQLHSIDMRLSNLEAKVDASHGDIKQELQQQLGHINRNVSRIQLLAPTQRAPQNNNTTAPVRTSAAQLGKPKCMHSLWVEYTHGLGGNKAAKDFTPTERGRVKQKYYRRKTFWDIVSTLVNAGYGAPAAVDKVWNHYGRSSSVTAVLNSLLADKKQCRHVGGVHPVFHIGRRMQATVARRQMTHLPQTQAQRVQPQQNSMRRYMIEQRAAPTQALREVPLARLQQRANQETTTINGVVATRQLVDI